MFQAQFAGRCSACGERYAAGAALTANGVNDRGKKIWKHFDCGEAADAKIAAEVYEDGRNADEYRLWSESAPDRAALADPKVAYLFRRTHPEAWGDVKYLGGRAARFAALPRSEQLAAAGITDFEAELAAANRRLEGDIAILKTCTMDIMSEQVHWSNRVARDEQEIEVLTALAAEGLDSGGCRDEIYRLNNGGENCGAPVYRDGLCEDHYWGTQEALAEREQEAAAYTAEMAAEDAAFAKPQTYRDEADPETRKCRRCAGTGQFITRVENGQPKGPGGICFRCNGKGRITKADERRNWGYDNFGMRV